MVGGGRQGEEEVRELAVGSRQLSAKPNNVGGKQLAVGGTESWLLAVDGHRLERQENGGV